MKYQEFYDFVVKVHSIAKIGLTFSKDPYAIDNYKELNDLSREMRKIRAKEGVSLLSRRMELRRKTGQDFANYFHLAVKGRVYEIR